MGEYGLGSLFELGKKVLGDQPFSQYMGVEMTLFEQGKAELTLTIREELKQNHGFVHGGVIGFLADNCLGCVAASVYGNCVTSEYKINFLRPAIGESLIAKASLLSVGKRQAVCECNVYTLSESGEVLVAVAQGTVNKIQITQEAT